jgi:hypothetical protein
MLDSVLAGTSPQNAHICHQSHNTFCSMFNIVFMVDKCFIHAYYSICDDYLQVDIFLKVDRAV